MEVIISTAYITLAQFLKKTDMISSGGEAKIFLASQVVYVNGERENRRGRKLYPEDKIEVLGQKYAIKG